MAASIAYFLPGSDSSSMVNDIRSNGWYLSGTLGGRSSSRETLTPGKIKLVSNTRKVKNVSVRRLTTIVRGKGSQEANDLRFKVANKNGMAEPMSLLVDFNLQGRLFMYPTKDVDSID